MVDEKIRKSRIGAGSPAFRESTEIAGGSEAFEKIIDVDLRRAKITTSAMCIKNKDPRYAKPCEDFHICDEKQQIFIIMDGATRYVPAGEKYPDPSPAALAASLFSETVHQSILKHRAKGLSGRELLFEAVQEGNRAVHHYNVEAFPEIDFLENDFANACGLASVIEGSTFHYVYLGDPQGYLIRDGKLERFTTMQTEIIDNLEKISRKQDGFDSSQFRKEVCSKIRNNRGAQYAFGSFTGEHAALEMLEFGEVSLLDRDRLLLTTDGLLPVYTFEPERLTSSDYPKIIETGEKLEKLRGIRSDDKTLIAVNFTITG